MAYQKTKPLATDRLKDSQSDLQNNFTYLEDNWETNHGTFNTADSYKNKYSIYMQQPALIGVGGTEIGLVARASASSGSNELYINHGGAGRYPMTANRPNEGETATGNNGWAFTSSGMLFKWGFTDLVANTNTTITFAVGANYPVFQTNIFNVICTPSSANPNNSMVIVVKDLTSTSFDAWCSQAVTCYWMAFGLVQSPVL